MRKILLLGGIIFSTFLTFAQKKPLDHTVYDSWQSINGEKISNDGKYVAYAVTPQEGDNNLFIKNLKTNTLFNYQRAGSFDFSFDNQFAAFLIKPFFKDTRLAKIKKKKADDMPKDSLGVVSLANSQFWKIPRVKSYKFPKKAGNAMAYLLDKEPADTSKKKATVKKDDADFLFADEPVSATAKEGNSLILRDLKSQSEITFKAVTEYEFSENGKFLLFATTAIKKDSTLKAGTFLYNLEKKQTTSLTTGKGVYKNLIFDEEGNQIAFTADKTPEKALVKIPKLYYYNFKTDSATVIAQESTQGMPKKFSVSENGRLYFSKDGARLFFGTAPILSPKDTTIVDFEVAKLDIWNYKDEELQPMQLANLNRELKKSYLAMYLPAQSNKIMQLASEELSDVFLPQDGLGNYALGVTDFGNRIAMQWQGSTLESAYLISLADGSKKTINLNKNVSRYALSPKGNYVVWFDKEGQSWYSFNINTAKTVKLETPNPIKFGEEDNDVPDFANPYGLATWTDNDQQVLIYDRYDIWSFDPSTGTGKNITNGFGRSNLLTFRYANPDPEKKSISVKETIWLSTLNNVNKQKGWFKKNMADTKNPEKVILTTYNFSAPKKAQNADIFIYSKSNYQASPDLYVSSNFIKETKLSEINIQQKNYNWGTAELVKWTTAKGYQSEGILYKPENFDANKKYPMIVYFYEKLSDGLYSYQAPAPTASRLNISFFVSNGYLVFAPDISYEIGYPGKSAEEFINSGVEELKKNTWVDGTKIGLQGQSWGGYQIAHLITRTNMYAAAWAGAPVANMTSAYGGIRWTSGLNRQFQYEKTQSRIGATLWEKPELYIENSPLFHFPKVQTPVVIMANDGDGSVPWYQGIEMFTGLRRLGKPVWMLNYNGDDHNLVLRQNRKDIQIREQQFFDHFLKGAPQPVWMAKGVPATEKGKNWGFDLVTDK